MSGILSRMRPSQPLRSGLLCCLCVRVWKRWSSQPFFGSLLCLWWRVSLCGSSHTVTWPSQGILGRRDIWLVVRQMRVATQVHTAGVTAISPRPYRYLATGGHIRIRTWFYSLVWGMAACKGAWFRGTGKRAGGRGLGGGFSDVWPRLKLLSRTIKAQ